MASKGQYRDNVKDIVIDDPNVLSISNVTVTETMIKVYVLDRNPKQNAKPPQSELPDEIALRDEIFQLKRQIMQLKKANERNMIKVRKYEDEAKKKDRQIEQLMDPVKNGDVRKLLSTKGAALLLNLKEQNNTLVQMILDKNTQIRRLLSEVKTSKLYANTRRAEAYRNEIERLRNLLIKSEAMMKEAQEVPQRRSICVGGAPALEMTLSSDQSSPRDLEELHFTIQSLEMHMKYSNDLLARKNEQIIRLTDQINSHQCSKCGKLIQMNVSEYRGNTAERDVSSLSGNTYEIISPKSTVLFEKNISIQHKEQPDRNRIPNSAPPGTMRDGDTPRHGTDQQSEEEGNIRFRLAKTNNQLGRFFIHDDMNYAENLRSSRRSSRSSFTATDESDMETAEFELMEKKIENDQIEVESPVKLKPADGQSDSSGLGESPLEPKDNPEDADSRKSLTLSEKDIVRTLSDSDDGNAGNCDGNREMFVIERDYRRLSPDPYDSDSSTASMQEVEVEAEINHNGVMEDNSRVDDEDDDDDVVVC